MEHGPDGLGFGVAGSEEQDVTGVEDGLETDGGAERGGMFIVEPATIGLDGGGVELDETGGGVGIGTGFIEAEVPVGAESEHDDIESTELADAILVGADGVEGHGFERVQGKELRGRDTPCVRDRVAKQVGTGAWMLVRDADVFIDGEDVEVGEFEMSGGDDAIERKRGVATGDQDVAGVRIKEPVGEAIGGG
jgi:hypothetical protein